ncbi:metallophosphoesterase 1 isoform X2 [Zootermopsis nevadensis]|uniref:Metallophosphoesterase 1 homolog n=1 Tax=Zootermopsis nevadensis TaxID=136037 RepID=A0A067RJK9_ZOONE|nr:metallophosphoesterase 1 isoform X2 [Zootermopsis nevadensis]KDR24002.1 Metallophosphoesterase 1 [Zootermopsis nevadensis]
MGLRVTYLSKCFLVALGLVFYCEFLIYYIVLLQCWWPQLDPNKADNTINLRQNEQPVRALLLADTHLLGSRKGHWFDKLRREWQMYRAFQTAMGIHNPDIVFVLGDLFDEGLWCSEKEFAYYVNRFNDLFRVPAGSQMFVVVGNHDVGFHYGISPYLHERFSSAFDAQSVRLVSVKGNHFVLVNSMAMEGDGCFLCRPAELQLQKISRRLKCTNGVGRCDRGMDLTQYSRPILLQHFPMYRESDAECSEPDQAPKDEKTQKFRERWECVSKESSEQLLDILKPRLIVTGHTHHGCHRTHREDIHEWTLPSFSWRNKDNPSFMLAVFTPNNYAVSKCAMPRESTVIWLYMFGGALLFFWIMLTYRRLCRHTRWFKTN